MRWWGLFIALALLVPAGLGVTQEDPGARSYGGKDRGGVASGILDPLDVIVEINLLEEGEVLPSAYSQGLVPTKDGLVAVVVDLELEVCRTLRLPWEDLGRVLRGVDFPCDASDADYLRTQGGVAGRFLLEGTTATSYDAHSDVVIACTASLGTSPVLQALDSGTGAPAWTVSLQDLGLLMPEISRVEYTNEPWYCVGTSLDLERRVGLVGLSTYGDRNAVVMFNLDTGEPVWVKTITPASLAAAQGSSVDLDPPTSTRDGFVAWTSTLTDTGAIITGAFGQFGHPALVWLDREGDLIGWTSTEADAFVSQPALGTMSTPSVSGSLGAVAFQDRLLIVEPTAFTPVEYPLVGKEDDPADLYEFWPGPAWWDDHLIVALTGSITDYDSSNGRARWTLPNPAGWQPADTFISPPSDVYMLAARSNQAGSLEDDLSGEPTNGSAELFRISIHDGSLLQRVPLPATDLDRNVPVGRNNAIDWGARMVPLVDGRVVVLEDDGHLMVMGRADEDLRPGLMVSSDYPATAEAVTVDVETPEDAVSILLAWGDGSVNEIEPGQMLTHSYGDPGTHTIRATVVYEDNRTATAVHPVNVGGTAPAPAPDLNFLQEAFARENQDLTFGVLGILVALGGGLFALSRRYTKRGRLQRELRELEADFEANKTTPPACEAMLVDRKKRFRDLLEHGKLDEPQYTVLDVRVDEMARQVRLVDLDEQFDFLPHGLVKALKDMLADGRISAWERQHVLRALEEDEVLSKRQKQKVRARVDEWFERDKGVEV